MESKHVAAAVSIVKVPAVVVVAAAVAVAAGQAAVTKSFVVVARILAVWVTEQEHQGSLLEMPAED